MGTWVRAAAVDDITEGGAKSFAHLDKRIALFRTPRGVYACDNRCPHQGYALVRGDVKDGVLTCAWHNWKFDLGTRRLHVRRREHQDLPGADQGRPGVHRHHRPAAEMIRPELFASLNAAMEDLDVGRMARDTMRLQRIGTPLADVIREGVRYAAPQRRVRLGPLARDDDRLPADEPVLRRVAARAAGHPGPVGRRRQPGQAARSAAARSGRSGARVRLGRRRARAPTRCWSTPSVRTTPRRCSAG